MKNYYMTDEEMDKFLESIGGLENGFFSDRPKIKSNGFLEISNGWFGLVKELIEDCIALGWNKEICQIKEKFGGLRFYINSAPDEVFKRIREAEDKSFTTCEVTGNPGQLRTDIGWYRTLCEEEYEKIKKEKNGGIQQTIPGSF
jgi:hypothetical protein